MKHFLIILLTGIISIFLGIVISASVYMTNTNASTDVTIEKIEEQIQFEEIKEEEVVNNVYETPEPISILWQSSSVIEELQEENAEVFVKTPTVEENATTENVETAPPSNPPNNTEVKVEEKYNTDYPYVTSLAEGEFYINIKKINVHKFWTSRGIGDEQAQLGVGGSLLNGTPYPSKNSGNAVIGGHREWYNNWNPFYHIDKLQGGDTIEVAINGETLKYKVFDSYTIHETAIDTVSQEFGYPVLTLYSCTIPISEYRYVVHAKYYE